MIKEEWKVLKRSSWLKVVLAAIVVIPTIYASIFLGSMWDPYGSADKIPVAVVNTDKEVQYNGSTLAIGNELVSDLKESKAMDFQFVNDKEANQGLENGTYYMKIMIPKDFSSCATTLLDSNPKKMVLEYTTNPGNNYIASKMGESAITKIKEGVSTTVTKTYADTIFKQIGTLSKGLKQASDGSSQLGSGVDQAVVGNETITTNLQTLASSSLRFKEGINTLDVGLHGYIDGVDQINQGMYTLQQGTTQLQEQTSPLVNGVPQLSIGASSLNKGVEGYGKGVQEVYLGSRSLVNNNETLNTGMTTLLSGIQKVSGATSVVNQQLQDASLKLNQKLQDNQETITKVEQGNGELKASAEGMLLSLPKETKQIIDAMDTIDKSSLSQADKDTVLQALNNAKDTSTTLVGDAINPGILPVVTSMADNNNQMITSLVDGLTEVHVGLDGTTKTMGATKVIETMDASIKDMETTVRTTLVPSVELYSQGVDTLNKGLSKLDQKTESLVQGSTTVAANLTNVSNKLPSLSKGIEQLQTGTSTLVDGTNSLVSNNNSLLKGTKTLQEGSVVLSDGAKQLANGSVDLSLGLAKIKDGTGELTTSLNQGSIDSNLAVNDTTIDMMATPIVTNHQEISKVENNGYAMAPYMMSVALYVACMAFTLMYPLLKNIKEARSGFKYWLSKASIMYSVATIQAIIMIVMLMLVNGMIPQQIMMTFIFAIIVSLAFMSIIVFFNILLGKIGSFIVLIFMVLQLGGAAGTYPIETSGKFYQILHTFMPFSYSVEGFRHTLSMDSFVNNDMFVFILLFVIFSVLSILVYQYKNKHHISKIEKAFD